MSFGDGHTRAARLPGCLVGVRALEAADLVDLMDLVDLVAARRAQRGREDKTLASDLLALET